MIVGALMGFTSSTCMPSSWISNAARGVVTIQSGCGDPGVHSLNSRPKEKFTPKFQKRGSLYFATSDGAESFKMTNADNSRGENRWSTCGRIPTFETPT